MIYEPINLIDNAKWRLSMELELIVLKSILTALENFNNKGALKSEAAGKPPMDSMQI